MIQSSRRGSTETTGSHWFVPPGFQSREAVCPVGYMLPGVDYAVLGEDGRVVGHTRVHVVRVALHLRHADGTLGRSEQFGQTVFARHTARRGWTTDEDAPKKSLTDALAKAASWLGIAADIHLGRWDDARYVEERRDEEARERTARAAKGGAMEADGLRRRAAEAEASIAAAGTDAAAFLAARAGASALRQPLEDGHVTIVRGQRSLLFPTRFMLVAATNPCPCGFAGVEDRCSCGEADLRRHRRRLSGPLLDRLDLLLTGRQLSSGVRDTIRTAMEDVPLTATSTNAERLRRVQIGVALILASTDYLIQK